ncbi:MAG: zinc-binding alcohol dehydrogenase [Geminicoccaceae bacterium]
MEFEAEAYWAVAPGQGEIRPVALPAPGADEVLVETRWSAISRGTEALVAMGRVPDSQARAMRCPFQEGTFPFPVKYGYCSVGTVARGPEALCGRTVFCLHPHQTRYVVPASAVHALPDGLPAGRAVLAANMETALNAVWDAGMLPGERIAVIGAGVVGCLIARLAVRLPGAEVTLVDIDPAKAGIARALGLPFRTDAEGLAPADCVVNASGSGAGLAAGLAMAGIEARLVEVSWHGDAGVTLPLGEAFHSRRLRLVSSQVGMIAPAMRPRFDHRRRFAKAMELLAADPALDALIDGESPFHDLPATLPALLRDGAGGLCHRVVYPPG